MDRMDRLAKERRARLAAERLLEQKSRELFAANEKLALHARALSDQIVEQQPLPEGFGTVALLSEKLFTDFLLPFEITSVLLLVAAVGAVVLAKR